MRTRIHLTTYAAARDAATRYCLGAEWLAALVARADVAMGRRWYELPEIPPRQICGRETSVPVDVPESWRDRPYSADQALRWYLREYDRGTSAYQRPADHVAMPDGSVQLLTRSEAGELRRALEMIVRATETGDGGLEQLAYIRGIAKQALA